MKRQLAIMWATLRTVQRFVGILRRGKHPLEVLVLLEMLKWEITIIQSTRIGGER